MQLHKSSFTRTNTSSDKFYIKTCPIDQIQATETLYKNDQRAILKAIYDVNLASSIQNGRNLVVKIGTSESLKKEYLIGERIQNIPGFMKYICLTQCNDKLERYQNIASKTKICPSDTNNSISHDHSTNILVMPYMQDSSVRKFKWLNQSSNHMNEERLGLFKSVLKQIILSNYFAFTKHDFLHSDSHLDNVLMRRTKKVVIDYDSQISITSYGYQICIMDFELSHVNVDTTNPTNRGFFYEQFNYMFADLASSMQLEIDNINDIMTFITYSIRNSILLQDFVKGMLVIIDKIKDVHKKQVTFIYNPNVY